MAAVSSKQSDLREAMLPPLKLGFNPGWIRPAVLLKTSRLPMYTASVVAYLICATSSTGSEKMSHWTTLVVAILYLTFPWNFVIFGMNDFADWDVDSVNPRRLQAEKSNRVSSFGHRCSQQETERLPAAVVLSQLPWMLWTFAIAGFQPASYYWISLFMANSCYNGLFGLPAWSRIPFIDVLGNLWGWPILSVQWFLVTNPGCELSDLLGDRTTAPLLLFWAVSVAFLHLSHTHFDRDFDSATGKITSGVWLGKSGLKVVIPTLWFLSAIVMQFLVPDMFWIGIFMHCVGVGVALNKVHYKYGWVFSLVFAYSSTAYHLPFPYPWNALTAVAGIAWMVGATIFSAFRVRLTEVKRK